MKKRNKERTKMWEPIENALENTRDPVHKAVWLAAAIMSQNCLQVLPQSGEDITLNDFAFVQARIRDCANILCTQEVQPPRIQQWFNGDHPEKTHNFLRAAGPEGKQRRLTAFEEFDGDKEIPDFESDLNLPVCNDGNNDVIVHDIIIFARAVYKFISQ